MTLVGSFIRTRRESVNLSQRALGLLFSPPVTTQFISNIERGVTPLPLCHVPSLTKALSVRHEDLAVLLEKEFLQKLSDKLPEQTNGTQGTHSESVTAFFVESKDIRFFSQLVECFKKLNTEQKVELYSNLQRFFDEKLENSTHATMN